MDRITLDLHPIFRDGKSIVTELGRAVDQAVKENIPMLEIISGKGSGELRRHVIRFLHLPHIEAKYRRMEVDEANRGKIVVYFHA